MTCRTRRLAARFVAIAVLAAGGLPVAADQWTTVDSELSSVLVEQNTRLRKLDPIFHQLFLPDADEDVKLSSTIQLFPVDPTLFGIPRARGRARATMGCFGSQGQQNLGSMSRRFDRNGTLEVSKRVPANLDCEVFFVDWKLLRNFLLPAGTSISARSAVELVGPGAPSACFDTTTLCLDDDRFRVEVDWRDFAGQTGPGIAFPRTDDSGTFFFFDADNTELLLKVLDGCARNDHFWVFFGATTNVEYSVTVTDTLSGQSRVYDNPLGGPAPPIQDTQAFATCP